MFKKRFMELLPTRWLSWDQMSSNNWQKQIKISLPRYIFSYVTRAVVSSQV